MLIEGVTLRIEKYIEGIGDRAAAKLFGVSVQTTYAWRTGRRVPRPAKALQIEKITGGKVTVKECY